MDAVTGTLTATLTVLVWLAGGVTVGPAVQAPVLDADGEAAPCRLLVVRVTVLGPQRVGGGELVGRPRQVSVGGRGAGGQGGNGGVGIGFRGESWRPGKPTWRRARGSRGRSTATAK